MDPMQMYNEARARAEKAEKRVRELEAELKETRSNAKVRTEDFTLRDALRSAGVADKAIKGAIVVLRGESAMLDFKDDGAFDFASFAGRTFRDPRELASAFVERFPNFTQAHVDAVSRDRSAGNGARDFDSMSPEQMAASYLESRAAKEDAARRQLMDALRRAEGGETRASGNAIEDEAAAGLRNAGF